MRCDSAGRVTFPPANALSQPDHEGAFVKLLNAKLTMDAKLES